MRPFRLAPALISALVLHASVPSPARAQTASEEPAETEELTDEAKAALQEEERKAAEGEAAAGEEEMTAEEKAEMEKELAAEEAASAALLTKPPPKGKGAIVGVVTDTKFNESIIEAPVTVLGGKQSTFTDVEGRFRLELPPGTYSIRVRYDLHQPARVDKIVVQEGKIVRVDASLVPDETAVETVEIVTDVDKTSIEGQTLERRRSAAVGDGVGRAEIARTPDRNAAEAARRVVGASIIGGRFVYVRGLGERYTNAALNGAPLPSTEPDRNTVPLDLFPALVIDSLTINKTFTPDQPADFAGGSVRIFTRTFPRETLLQLSLTAGLNTATTFRDGLGYQGSSTDWLGYDGGLRQLPDDVPDEKIEGELAEQHGPRLNSRMSTRRQLMPPNHGGSLVVGDAWKLGKQKLGALVALNYGRSFQIIADEKVRVFRLPDAGSFDLVPRVNYRAERGIDAVRWGAFGSVSYEPVPNHRLSLNAFHSQSGDDTALEMEGKAEATGENRIHVTRLNYSSRALDFGQLRGEHDFPALGNARLDWFGSLSYATRNEPDTRANMYMLVPNPMGAPSWTWQVNAQSGSHFFADQGELQRAGGLDWTQPFGKADDAPKAKVGGLVSVRDREFDARRFEFAPARRRPADFAELIRCDGPAFPQDCSDKLFQGANVNRVIAVSEKTRENDAYDAGLDVYAGYLQLDGELTKGLRAVGGARVEKTKQTISSFNPFAPDEKVSGDIDETDVLPALSLVYAAGSKANTRLAVSRTLARPQLRELAPFVFNPYFGGFPTQGNADLRLTYITNADVRFEYFPTMREVLAFSFFYKHFKDPIEEVLRTRGDTYVTFDNAPAADLIGLELEARKGLDFLTGGLKDFSLLANLTLVKSKVNLDNVGVATNASRPLSNQSPYIVNMALDYSHPDTKTQARILYNVNGKRIVTVGSDGLEDIYEKPRHQLDLTVVQGIGKNFELKANAQNLLNAKFKTTQLGPDPDGDGPEKAKEFVTGEFRQGVSFSLSASYTY
jgi:hypothetical protein